MIAVFTRHICFVSGLSPIICDDIESDQKAPLLETFPSRVLSLVLKLKMDFLEVQFTEFLDSCVYNMTTTVQNAKPWQASGNLLLWQTTVLKKCKPIKVSNEAVSVLETNFRAFRPACVVESGAFK